MKVNDFLSAPAKRLLLSILYGVYIFVRTLNLNYWLRTLGKKSLALSPDESWHGFKGRVSPYFTNFVNPAIKDTCEGCWVIAEAKDLCCSK